MIRAFRLLLTAASDRAGLAGRHARAMAMRGALLAVFGLATLIFAATLATVALSRWLGVLPALGIMAGLAAAGFLATLLALRAARRSHEASLRLQASQERRMLEAALLSAVPQLRTGGLLAVAAGLTALTLLLRRGRDDTRD